jgi:hypothetical protein
MNRKLFGVLVIIALAFAVNASAQSKARADIPFSFAVGEKSLPAGTYNVTDVAPGTIVLRSVGHSDAAMIQFHAAEKVESQSPRLVFHKYGDQCFLYQIWDGEKRGMELRESKSEKQLEKELSLAGNKGSAPQEVVVALR